MVGAKTCLFLVGAIIGVAQGFDFCKLDGVATYPCNTTAECILETYRCDGEGDCKDNSDEWNCDTQHTCNSNAEIDCGDGTCRPLSYRCDGEDGCKDGRDERGCPVSLDLQCTNGEIVEDMMAFRCDEYPDCEDESDESGCEAYRCHPAVQFDCGDGKCIPNYYQCDGMLDCSDERDEDDCDV